MLEGIPFEKLTAPSLVGLIVVLILLGWLVPRRTLQDKQDEAERWRQAYETERQARSEADAQTAELLEVARTTHALIQAIFSNSEQMRREREVDAISSEA